jgi:hypothetical protein
MCVGFLCPEFEPFPIPVGLWVIANDAFYSIPKPPIEVTIYNCGYVVLFEKLYGKP